MNSQKKLGNGVCDLWGGDSYQMELWGITETASFQTLIFKIITTAIHKPFMLGFRHLESLRSHNYGLPWAGHHPLFFHFFMSLNEETKGRPKEGKWLVPGNKLECVEGEATDPGLAPSAGLGGWNWRWIILSSVLPGLSGFRNRRQVGSLEMTSASLTFGGWERVWGGKGQGEQKHTLEPSLIFVPDQKLWSPSSSPTPPLSMKAPGVEGEALFTCMVQRLILLRNPRLRRIKELVVSSSAGGTIVRSNKHNF